MNPLEPLTACLGGRNALRPKSSPHSGQWEKAPAVEATSARTLSETSR